jgi:hypothetical protein
LTADVEQEVDTAETGKSVSTGERWCVGSAPGIRRHKRKARKDELDAMARLKLAAEESCCLFCLARTEVSGPRAWKHPRAKHQKIILKK